MDRKQIEVLKQKFMAGQCTPKELEALEQWQAELPGQASPEAMDDRAEKQLEAMLWKGITDRLSDEAFFAPPGRVRSRFINWHWTAAAAVLLLVVSGALAYFYRIQRPVAATGWITANAVPGQITKITLPDSSTVWLNAATVLHYPSSFGKTLREIKLEEGEAFFDVKKNPRKPFVVRAGAVQTKVLGTSFRVKAYRVLPEVKVGVATGRVEVRDSLRVLGLLTPNEQIAVHPASGRFRKELVGEDEMMGWRTNQLAFRQAPFREVALALENRFGVKLAFDTVQVDQLRLTLQIPADWKVEQALDVLATLSNTRYTTKNHDVHFYLTP